MKYKMQLRDDNMKIHPVSVSIPGEENEAAAIVAGIEHLTHLGHPFSLFEAEDDLMEMEISCPESVFQSKKTLPENYSVGAVVTKLPEGVHRLVLDPPLSLGVGDKLTVDTDGSGNPVAAHVTTKKTRKGKGKL